MGESMKTIRTVVVYGDGVTDDTAALQAIINGDAVGVRPSGVSWSLPFTQQEQDESDAATMAARKLELEALDLGKELWWMYGHGPRSAND